MAIKGQHPKRLSVINGSDHNTSTAPNESPATIPQPVVENQESNQILTTQQMIDMLKRGVDEWNEWRKRYPKAKIDLREVNLEGANLGSVNLSVAHLEGANLIGASLMDAHLEHVFLMGAHLEGANLIGAHLQKAFLMETHLEGAVFCNAHLEGAYIQYAHLERAILADGDFSQSNLSGADLTDATLTSANLSNTNVTGVIYDRKKMAGEYQGVRVDTCFGNAVFKRDAQDQDYIDTLRPLWGKGWRKPLFTAWAFIDYGRSIPRVALSALAIMLFFGILYTIFPGLVDYGIVASPNANTPVGAHYIVVGTNVFDIMASPKANTPCIPNHPTWFEPFYYSVVTFTTLGFGDVSANGVAGQMAVVFEVVLGYITLGLLISILGNMVARRS